MSILHVRSRSRAQPMREASDAIIWLGPDVASG
jgi:hypothetical protein